MRAFAIGAWSAGGDLAEPRRLAVGRRSLAQAIRIAGAMGLLIGGVLWIAHAVPPAPAAVPPVPEVSPPLWRDIADPAPRYSLEAPEFAGAPAAYAARLHVAGGGREDTLSFGPFASAPSEQAAPALRLRIFRRASEAPSPTPLFAAIAHEAAQAGLSVERIGLPEILPTRLGRFEIADVALAGPKAESARTCSGFRLIRDEPALSITGLACGTPAVPLARPELACLVGRLGLFARDDQELSDFFLSTALDSDPGCPIARAVAGAPGTNATDAEDRNLGKPATSRKSLRRR